MNIWMIGDFSENLDEGFKNTCHYISTELEKNDYITLDKLNIKELFSLPFWINSSRNCPDIIQAIAQPTFWTLFYLRLLKFFWPKSKSIIWSLRSDKFFLKKQLWFKKAILKRLKPDFWLSNTTCFDTLLKSVGVANGFLPVGVDIDRFKPVSKKSKEDLRKKYQLDIDKPVVLHVGHLERSRNLESLRILPKNGVQVVIAGSLYMGLDEQLLFELQSYGYSIFTGFQTNIEEFYQLADCYIFPVKPGNSLSMPLSVIEAMATNLPIISTKFIGLVDAFSGVDGIFFVDRDDEIYPLLRNILYIEEDDSLRNQVRNLSWEKISERLISFFEEVIEF